jgi:hypothetical protein
MKILLVTDVVFVLRVWIYLGSRIKMYHIYYTILSFKFVNLIFVKYCTQHDIFMNETKCGIVKTVFASQRLNTKFVPHKTG